MLLYFTVTSRSLNWDVLQYFEISLYCAMTLPPPLRPVSQRTAITNEGKGEGGKKYPRSPSGRSAISWVPFEEKESREKSQKSHKFNNFLGGSKDMIKQGKMKKVEHLLKLDDFTKKIQVTATSCSEFYGRQKPVCPPHPPVRWPASRPGCRSRSVGIPARLSPRIPADLGAPPVGGRAPEQSRAPPTVKIIWS